MLSLCQGQTPSELSLCLLPVHTHTYKDPTTETEKERKTVVITRFLPLFSSTNFLQPESEGTGFCSRHTPPTANDLSRWCGPCPDMSLG